MGHCLSCLRRRHGGVHVPLVARPVDTLLADGAADEDSVGSSDELDDEELDIVDGVTEYTDTKDSVFTDGVKKILKKSKAVAFKSHSDCAHAGVPDGTDEKKGYWIKVAQDLYPFFKLTDDSIKGVANGMYIARDLHEEYDRDLRSVLDETRLVAFLPMLTWDQLKQWQQGMPFQAVALAIGLARGALLLRARKGRSLKDRLPRNWQTIVNDLQEHEFAYDRTPGRMNLSYDGSDSKRAQNYEATDRHSLQAAANSAAQQMEQDGWNLVDKYVVITFPAQSTVHPVWLRLRACRLLRHEKAGPLPNGGTPSDSASSDSADSAAERQYIEQLSEDDEDFTILQRGVVEG